MTIETISRSIFTKYGNGQGSNPQPLDLQLDTLPTALRGLVWRTVIRPKMYLNAKNYPKTHIIFPEYAHIYNVRTKCFDQYKRGKTNKIDSSLHYVSIMHVC